MSNIIVLKQTMSEFDDELSDEALDREATVPCTVVSATACFGEAPQEAR